MVSVWGRDTLRPHHLLPVFVLMCGAWVCGQVLKGLIQWAVLAEVSGRNVGGLGCFTTVTEWTKQTLLLCSTTIRNKYIQRLPRISNPQQSHSWTFTILCHSLCWKFSNPDHSISWTFPMPEHFALVNILCPGQSHSWKFPTHKYPLFQIISHSWTFSNSEQSQLWNSC